MQMPRGLIPLSSKTVTGAISTIQFFLSEAYMGQHFETVELSDTEPEPGDLFLFKMTSPLQRLWCGAHVGVYCGGGEIIHFEGEDCRLKNQAQLHQGRLAGLVSLLPRKWTAVPGCEVA